MMKRKKAKAKFFANDYVGAVRSDGGGRVAVYRTQDNVRIEVMPGDRAGIRLVFAPDLAEKIARLVVQAATTTPLKERPVERDAA